MNTSLDGKYPLRGRTHCGDTDGTKQLQQRSVLKDFGSVLTLPAVASMGLNDICRFAETIQLSNGSNQFDPIR